jgi:hypothetical protein
MNDKQEPIPPPTRKLRRPSMLSEILDRVVRIETRVVKLMDHHGLDASGNPSKTKKPNTY